MYRQQGKITILVHSAGGGELFAVFERKASPVEGRHATQVIKGSYTQTDQLQGYNALAPTASSNLTSALLSAAGPSQVPSNSVNQALSDALIGANAPSATSQVQGNAKPVL
jgi:hypothetical protein